MDNPIENQNPRKGDTSNLDPEVADEIATPLELPEHNLGQIGSYQLIQRLGEGGMGEVFKAVHVGLGRVVALKRIRPHKLRTPSAVKRFLKEVRAAARVDHPYIVRAYDANSEGDSYFLVMEFIDGLDLLSVVEQNGPLPIEDVLRVALEVGLALQHLHGRGLVHRDVKPSNLIRVHGTGVIKLMDLGLARILPLAVDDSVAKSMTLRGTILGTPDYMAPEQVLNAKKADIRSDLYSLGCTMYLLLTGSVPFPAFSPVQKLMKQVDETPPSIHTHRAGVPAEIVRLVERLMSKSPADRPQTPTDLLTELRAFTIKPVIEPMIESVAPGDKTRRPTQGSVDFWQRQFREWVRQNSTLAEHDLNPAELSILRRKRYRRIAVAISILIAAFLIVASVSLIRKTRKPPIANTNLSDGFDQRRELFEVYLKNPGSEQSILAAKALRALPSPLDALPTSKSGASSLHWGDSRGRQFGSVWSVAATQDGKFVASGGAEPGVYLWNLSGPTVKATLRGADAHTRNVAISADGKYAAAVLGLPIDGHPEGGQENSVRVWNLATHAELMKIDSRTAGKCLSCAFSPTLKWLVVGHAGRATLWNLETKDFIRNLIRPGMDECECVAFSPDGTRIYTGGRNFPQIRIWNTYTGELVSEVSPSCEPVQKIQPSPEGLRYLEVSARAARIWHLWSGNLIREMILEDREITAACWDSGGREIVVGCSNGYLAWIDSRSGQVTRSAYLENVRVTDLTPIINPERIIVASADGGIRQFRSSTAQEIYPIPRQTPAREIRFIDQDRRLLIVSDSNRPKVIDLPGGDVSKLRLAEGFIPVGASGDGSMVLGSENAGEGLIWNTLDNRCDPIRFPEISQSKLSVCLPKANSILFAHREENTICHRCLEDQGNENRHTASNTILSLAVSADGTRAAYGTVHGEIVGIRLPDLTVLSRKKFERGSVLQIVLSPDGETAFAVGPKLGLSQIRLKTGESVGMRGFSRDYNAISISADGQWLAVASPNGEIVLVSLSDESGNRRIRIPGIANTMAFSVDGKALAVGLRNGVTELYRITEKK